MINRNIIDVLHNYEFNIMRSNNPAYLFFGKQGDDSFETIVIIDDGRGREATDKLTLCAIRDSLERNLLLKGYKSVNVLFIITTSSPFAFKQLAEDDIPFWIVDETANRIISYAADDDAFTPLRNELEKNLVPSSANESGNLKEKLNRLAMKPFITMFLAIINILIFVYMDLFCNIIDQTLIKIHFSNQWVNILNHNEYYRLFTSMFLHADMVHVFSNMVTLAAVGMLLEPALGHIKFGLIYIMSGLIASITSTAYHYYLGEAVYSMGASGAIFGIFGAYAVYTLFDRAKGHPVPAFRIAFAAILILVNGMTSPYVDNSAHLGGIIAGSIISFICCICRKNKI